MQQKKSVRWWKSNAQATLKQLRASGVSVAAFARREGLDEWQLYRWRRRLAENGDGHSAVAPPSAPAVIELRASSRRAEVAEMVLASGITLRVAETIPPSTLAGLITVLR